ncbi:MAG TPA: response regulator [Bacteroidota bacterium]|nr:response regulator [Bacteroidota bacterium]
MPNTIQILMVEDNPGDVRLTKESLKNNGVKHVLYNVGDGVEALDFLFHRGSYANATRPDLIILDLNIPKKNGLEVLKEIKEDPSLRRIPVVVLTTSGARDDIMRSYDMHANCYIIKSVNLDEFINIVRFVESFWLGIVRLPKE